MNKKRRQPASRAVPLRAGANPSVSSEPATLVAAILTCMNKVNDETAFGRCVTGILNSSIVPLFESATRRRRERAARACSNTDRGSLVRRLWIAAHNSAVSCGPVSPATVRSLLLQAIRPAIARLDPRAAEHGLPRSIVVAIAA